MSTLFDKIMAGEVKSWIVWENDEYAAFLTPFPNTPGYTVVMPKKNPGDYIFTVDDEVYVGLMKATRTVARKLEKAFNTQRVAAVFEGTGVAHAHVKLIPLHGDLSKAMDTAGAAEEFSEEYRGYITSIGGPKMDDDELDKIQKKIEEA